MKQSVVQAIAEELHPTVFDDALWYSPYQKRMQVKLKRQVLKEARRVLKIVKQEEALNAQSSGLSKVNAANQRTRL